MIDIMLIISEGSHGTPIVHVGLDHVLDKGDVRIRGEACGCQFLNSGRG
jgi:hypothetical protein